MKKLLLVWVLATGSLVSISMLAHAENKASVQPNSNSELTTSPADARTVVLSGCLDRGSGADEFSLHGASANSWELKSDSINLGSYLNQTVTVLAVESGDAFGTLNVIDLRVSFNSCDLW